MRRSAHRHSHPLRQAIGGDRSHNDATALKRLENPRAIAYFHEHEVRDTRNDFKAEGAATALELDKSIPIFPSAFVGEFVVFEGSNRSRLCDGIDVEGLAHAIEQRAHFGGAIPIADAERGQTIDFLKRPEADYVSSLAYQRPKVWR